jgi:hypothetical protein
MEKLKEAGRDAGPLPAAGGLTALDHLLQALTKQTSQRGSAVQIAP